MSDDSRLTEMVKTVLQKGYVGLDAFLDEQTYADFHRLANDATVRGKKNEELRGTAVYDLAHSSELLALSQKIYDKRCEITGEPRATLKPENQFVGMPYKDGRAGHKNEETAYHYDGAYINWLLPLVLPADQSRGDGNLVMFPNLRLRYPKLMTKLVSRLLRHSKMLRNWFGQTEVVYKTDTMYLFFGDLSFHGVEPITNGERVVVTVNSHW